MPTRDIGFYIVDIFIAIDKIFRYTSEFDNCEDFKHSELNWDASIRELEIIGEATKYLLQEDILDSQYRRIVDFRNQISYGYFGIDETIVWEIIQNKLDTYNDDLHNIINKNSIDINDAINYAKEEYSKNSNVLNLLDSLK